MFPEFSLSLLKGCLTLLQYCQEISDPQIISKVLEIPTYENSILDESVLFFPALNFKPPERKLSGFAHTVLCAALDGMQNAFELMTFFHHVFFMFYFSGLPSPLHYPNTSGVLDDDDGATIVDVYSRKCTLWKNGIHWLMESGVEVVVEVVKQKRAVLVMVRGSSDQQVECGDILNKVVAKVVEAKSEFCNVLKAKVYIVSPD